MKENIETSLKVYDYPEPSEEEYEGGHYEKDDEGFAVWVSDEEEREVCSICPICGLEIYEDEETMNDDSNSYGGDCHESCFLEAQESRLQ